MGMVQATDIAISETIEKLNGKICIHVLREGKLDFRLIRTATTLVEAGLDVSLVDVETLHTWVKQEHGITMEHLVVPDWQRSRRFEPWFFLIAAQTLLRSVVCMMKINADIYHANELTALPAAFLAASLRRKKLVFEIYDLQFPVPLTGIGFWRHVGASLYGFLLPRCAGVIVTSAYHGEEVKKRYKVKKMALLRNVPLYRRVEKSDRLRQRLGLAAHVRIALYQGNIQADRELERLVYAARHLEPNIVIVMMGRGMQGVPEQLQELIAREGVADRVKIIPEVPYAELLDWTASADIGLTLFSPEYSLSIRYTLPNKLFEYLMAGLPVLSMKLEAIAEVLQNYEVGSIIQSLEPSEIALGINSMLAEPEVLERMKQNALKIACERFNWEKERVHLLRFYRELLL